MRPQRIWYTEDSGKGVSTLFQNIQHFSHTQKPVNEDACGFGRSFLFVLDGATGLGKREFMHAGSDAHWLSGSIRDRLLRELPQGSDPITVLKEELHRLRSQYLQAARTMPSAAETPSACIALFYERGDWLYYFGMGDCYGVVELKNGQVEVISDPILEELDQQALMRMKEISRKQQIPFFEARRQIQELLMHNRMCRNQPGGYHALDLEWDRLEEIEIHQWKKSDVRRVLCASDGFYEIMNYGIVDDPKELMDQLSLHGQEVVQWLFSAQDADAQAERCPRFKHRDDCTYVYAETEE